MPVATQVSPRQTHNSGWRIVSFHKPVGWNRSEGETWMFNPHVRYILNANQLDKLGTFIDSISDLRNGRFYHPLRLGVNLANSTILIERYRDRGLGDLLFMTGPMSYLKHVSGGSAKIHFYALADRAAILDHHPAMAHDTPLTGPVIYDSLPQYNHHWFVDTVTEYDEEKDQSNVYDALYKQLGVDPATVDHRFKRPSMTLVDSDFKDLDQLYYFIYVNRKLDLRSNPYYVVAPLANANLRMADYAFWLRVIAELAKVRPVLVMGAVTDRMPSADMPFGSFNSQLDELTTKLPIVNLIGGTPIRVLAALISRAVCLVTLDTGPLYIAQALRVPAISVWGPHNPMMRLGYDREYIDLAVWEKQACSHAPCCAYSRFPIHKCPLEANTVVCEVLRATDPSAVIEKVAYVERKFSEAQRMGQPAKANPSSVP